MKGRRRAIDSTEVLYIHTHATHTRTHVREADYILFSRTSRRTTL